MPILASELNMVEYGVQFIPDWWAEFFWNFTNLMSIVQSDELLTASQATNVFLPYILPTGSLNRTLQGCLGDEATQPSAQ